MNPEPASAGGTSFAGSLASPSRHCQPSTASLWEGEIDNQAQEPARQGGTRLAQDVSPGWAGFRNPEPASAGGTSFAGSPASPSKSCQPSSASGGEGEIDNQAQEPARQDGTTLAQDVSPGWAGCRNYEPASAGDTIAWA
jgi:hypothetical protein